jgi:hypothetical protein
MASRAPCSSPITTAQAPQVALGAALSRASLAEIFTQEIKYHLRRGDMAHGHDLAI